MSGISIGKRLQPAQSRKFDFVNKGILVLIGSGDRDFPVVVNDHGIALLGSNHHVPVPADFILKGVGAGGFFWNSTAIGIQQFDRIELFRSVPVKYQINSRIQSNFRHYGDSGGNSLFLQIVEGISIIGIDDTDACPQSRLCGRPGELCRKQIDDAIHALLHQRNHGFHIRCVQQHRFNATRIQEMKIPDQIRMHIGTKDSFHPIVPGQIIQGGTSLNTAPAQHQNIHTSS